MPGSGRAQAYQASNISVSNSAPSTSYKVAVSNAGPQVHNAGFTPGTSNEDKE